MQTSPFIVGVDYKAIFLSPQTEREQEHDDIDDIEPSATSTRRASSRLNPKRQASQSVYTYSSSDRDSYLPPIFSEDLAAPGAEPNLPLLAFFEDDPEAAEDSSPSSTTAMNVNSKDQRDFQLFKPSTSADACSYDLRDTQEPPTISKEYPNYGSNKDNTTSKDLYDLDTKKDIKSQLEAEPGPVCFPSVSPTPDSPSRLETELHFHHQPEGDSSSSTKKPASSATASPKDIKPTIPASLSINPTLSNNNNTETASTSKAPASNTSSAGSSNSGIPVDPQLAGSSSSNMQQPQSAATTNYFDVSGMSNINNNGSNNARPMARAGQPSFLKDMGDGMIRTPGPGQMVSPKETFMSPKENFMDFTSILQNAAKNSNSTNNNGSQQQQQQQQQLGSASSDQAAQSLMAALGQAQQQHQLQQQLQQQQQQQQNSNQHQQQQQQRPQIAYPFPTNFQAKPEGLNTDIAVPSSSSTNNANNNGSNPLPPLPTNYQPPPAPLNFQDGSFFSHQAILASLAAEDNARLAAAMGQGNFGGGFNTASYIPTFPSTSTSGDVSVAQHFNQQQQPSTSVLTSPGNNTSDGSRKRGRGQNSKGKQQQQDTRQKGLTRENSGSQQPPSSVRSTYDMDGDEHNPFHTDASAFFNLDGNGLGLDLDAAKSYNEQMQAAGIPIPQSSRTSRASKKKPQQGADMGDFPVTGGSHSNAQGTGATRFGATEEDPLQDSSFSTEEDDEWVAEDSDDSFGKPAKKKGRKSAAGGAASNANTSNTTKATKTKKQSKKDSNNNSNNNNHNNVSTSNISSSTATAVPPLPPSSYSGFNFTPQFGPDGMFIMPAATDVTPLQSPQQPSKSENGTSERNKPAAPGTGSIVCDYVDPATGSVCQVRFRRPYDQARHLETVHGVGNDNKPKSVCYTCKKSFSRKDALIRHGRISGHVTFHPAPPPREEWEQS